MKKVLFFILLIIILTPLIYLHHLLPQREGETQFTGLKDKVEIFFDKQGIPHIKAQNSHDAYMALGHQMAALRLFQMELLKRIVRGQLSELFGPEFIETDKMLRTFGFYYRAKMAMTKIRQQTNPEAMEQIKAFLQGVNQYQKTHALPIEFTLLGIVPTKFTLEDVLGLSGYMALTFAEGPLSDLTFHWARENLSKEHLKALMNREQSDEELYGEQLPWSKKNLSNTPNTKKGTELSFKLFASLQKQVSSLETLVPLLQGSNSWVISPSRSKTGNALLANDPHIKLSAPGIFTEAHLSYPGFEIYGNYIPLAPFALLGHTPHSAWAFTMAETDDMDFYIENVNFDKKEYLYDEQWKPLIIREETIPVKGQESVRFSVHETKNGPLLENTTFPGDNSSISVKWSTLDLRNNNFETFYHLPRAKTVNEFKTALSFSTSPSLNVSWASSTGDIAWWVMNLIPKRKPKHHASLPAPGWDPDFQYERYLAIDENPHLVNPLKGLIVSANYKPFLKEFADIPGYWQPGGRFMRIEKLLATQEKWSLEEFQKVQLDHILPQGTNFWPWLSKMIDPAQLSPSEIQRYETMVAEWKGETDKENIFASIYFQTVGELIQLVFRDELKERYDFFAKGADMYMALSYLILHPENPFWDDVTTKKVESAQDIVHTAFKTALTKLEKKWGDTKWFWGKLHTVEFKHLLSKQPPLGFFFNIGPYPADGARYAINNIAFDKSGTDFTAVHGPATRRLIDLGDTKISYGILPTGVSGHFNDYYYQNQTEDYLLGNYRKQIMDWAVIENFAKLILRP